MHINAETPSLYTIETCLRARVNLLSSKYEETAEDTAEETAEDTAEA